MKKGIIIGIILLVAFTGFILITYPNMTGNVVISKQCVDSDRGIKEFIFGNVTTTDEYGNTAIYLDECSNNKVLQEGYCNSDKAHSISVINCNGTCENGACSFNCSESWDCEKWSTCYASEQRRTCKDLNGCNTSISKPVESQTCVVGANETIENISIANTTSNISETIPNLPEEPIPEIEKCSWFCKLWKSIFG